MDAAQHETDGQQRSASLRSGGSTSWTDGTEVEINWTYFFIGGRAGFYKASPVLIRVRPSSTKHVAAISVRVLERFRRSGMPAKDESFQLHRKDGHYECQFDWESTVNNPEQEVTILLTTSDPHEPTMRLRDPVSRRTNFLISFSG